MRGSAFKWLSSIVPLSDEQAMARVQNEDDEAAFELLARRWRQAVWRLCARMTQDPHRAEDLAQEAFLRLYAHRRRYRPEARFSTFLWRIALNLCRDEYRRIQRRQELNLAEPPLESPASLQNSGSPTLSPDESAIAGEEAEQVRRAVARLSESQRAVLVLRHYEGLKFREIAQVLEIPEGTVKSRMAEALVQLGQLLGQSHRRTTLR
jgi:RNA polymerase sigma-70 factor (ECF subfamily)